MYGVYSGGTRTHFLVPATCRNQLSVMALCWVVIEFVPMPMKHRRLALST